MIKLILATFEFFISLANSHTAHSCVIIQKQRVPNVLTTEYSIKIYGTQSYQYIQYIEYLTEDWHTLL